MALEVKNTSGTTWEILALGSLDPIGCLLCGAVITGPRKTLPLPAIDDALQKLEQKETAGASALVRACRNIVNTAQLVNADVAPADFAFNACACCHYWFQRRARRKIPLIPLLTLQWHLEVVHCERPQAARKERTFDVRVLQRLCRALACEHEGVHNYYLTLFRSAHQDLIREIAKSTIAEVSHRHALWFRKQNICTPFLHNARVAEVVRAAMAEKEALTGASTGL